MEAIQIKSGLDSALTLVIKQHEESHGCVWMLTCKLLLQTFLYFQGPLPLVTFVGGKSCFQEL